MKSKFLLVLMIPLIISSSVNAAEEIPNSPNYQVIESGFSVGSETNASSTSYNAQVSAGNLGVGNASSANFQSFAGFITPEEEYVELVIPLSSIDLGLLSPGTPGTGIAVFSARAYLNDNYVIVSPAQPPALEGDESRTINSLTTASTFDPLAEQFGINLVANTDPVVQGVAAAPQPNASFAYGQAAPGYDIPNNYQYNSDDVIAESVTRGYGETIYTISYMMNITNTTPGGRYVMDHDLVILATF